MAKYLCEDNDNEYAKAIRAVEKAFIDNDVEICHIGGPLFFRIKDRTYRLSKNTSSFPRGVDDERFVVHEYERGREYWLA